MCGFFYWKSMKIIKSLTTEALSTLGSVVHLLVIHLVLGKSPLPSPSLSKNKKHHPANWKPNTYKSVPGKKKTHAFRPHRKISCDSTQHAFPDRCRHSWHPDLQVHPGTIQLSGNQEQTTVFVTGNKKSEWFIRITLTHNSLLDIESSPPSG